MNTKKIEEFTEDFKKFLFKVREYEPIAILSHDNTDLDGAASVLGIKLILNYYGNHSSKLDVILSHSNHFVAHTLENIHLGDKPLLTDGEIREEYNTIIIIDTPYMPPYFQKKFKTVILIDHHFEPEGNGENVSDQAGVIEIDKIMTKLIDSTASSCSEIIGQIWKDIEEDPLIIHPNPSDDEKIISQLLLMGILMDSGGLRFSENSVVPVLEFLIQKGADLPTARSMFIQETPSDVRIARIKGAMRIEEPIMIDNWIVLITNVNSHESAVCTALLGLGADLAFCISKRKKGLFRVIGRSSETFQNAMSFHLAKFMEKLAQEYHGNSGGHKGAAGMNGENLPLDLKDQIIRKLKKELNN